MSEPKNLPIKLFSKRGNQDERFTEGGGSRELPSWAQGKEALFAKCQGFRESLNETAQILASRKTRHKFIPAVIKVTITPEALAKTHRVDVSKVFNRKRENNFIGMADDLEFLVRIEDNKHLQSLLRNLENPMAHQVGLSAIEEMETFKPEIDIPKGDGSLKVKLVNYKDKFMSGLSGSKNLSCFI